MPLHHAVLTTVSGRYSPPEGKLPTCYSPVRHFTHPRRGFHVRLACLRHAASVDSEPESNSRLKFFGTISSTGLNIRYWLFRVLASEISDALNRSQSLWRTRINYLVFKYLYFKICFVSYYQSKLVFYVTCLSKSCLSIFGHKKCRKPNLK